MFGPLVGFCSISIRQKQPPLARHSLTAADQPTGQLHSPQKIGPQRFYLFGDRFGVGVTLGSGLGCLVIIMCRGLDDHGGLTQYDNLNE